jgi:protein-disulfide isomerase
LVFAGLKGSNFREALFASPDFRFLTKDLLDAKPDPKAAAERRRQISEALAGSGAPARGSENSPVTLAIFSDFQCPFCARLAKTITELPAADQGRLRIIYHYFPLPMHKWARSAAEAAACAQRQSGPAFWSLHDYLFTNQKDLSAENLTPRLLEWSRIAPSFDQGEFETCVNRSLTSGQVEQDIALGNDLGVVGTPTVFLNGDLVENTSPERLAELLREHASAMRR